MVGGSACAAVSIAAIAASANRRATTAVVPRAAGSIAAVAAAAAGPLTNVNANRRATSAAVPPGVDACVVCSTTTVAAMNAAAIAATAVMPLPDMAPNRSASENARGSLQNCPESDAAGHGQRQPDYRAVIVSNDRARSLGAYGNQSVQTKGTSFKSSPVGEPRSRCRDLLIAKTADRIAIADKKEVSNRLPVDLHGLATSRQCGKAT